MYYALATVHMKYHYDRHFSVFLNGSLIGTWQLLRVSTWWANFIYTVFSSWSIYLKDHRIDTDLFSERNNKPCNITKEK